MKFRGSLLLVLVISPKMRRTLQLRFKLLLAQTTAILALVSWTADSMAQTAELGFAVETPVGQATGSTCQSYVLAVALAFKRDKDFIMNTSRELRSVEVAIRGKIVEAFKRRMPGAPKVNPSHDDIREGFAAYTSGVYKLSITDVDLPSLSDIAGKRTGVIDEKVVPLNFFLGALVKDVVISSATRIGDDTYGEGHLFTVFGISGPPNSNRKFLILNSAVRKQRQKQNACIDGVPDDPGPYTGSVSWRSRGEIEFKRFGDKYKLFTVERGP
jgi:hypothetical protein